MNTIAVDSNESPQDVLSTHPRQVTLAIRSVLGYQTWKTIQDAIRHAKKLGLPLQLDLKDCPTATVGGIGLLLHMYEKYGTLAISSCSDRMAYFFDGLGICAHCQSAKGSPCEGRREELRKLSVSEAIGLTSLETTVRRLGSDSLSRGQTA